MGFDQQPGEGGQRAGRRPVPRSRGWRRLRAAPTAGKWGAGGSATSGFGSDTSRRLLHHQGDARAGHRRVEERSKSLGAVPPVVPRYRAPAWGLHAASPFLPTPRHAAGPGPVGRAALPALSLGPANAPERSSVPGPAANSLRFEQHRYPLLPGTCFTGREGSGFASGGARRPCAGCCGWVRCLLWRLMQLCLD